ncbi:Ima1 N-terminal domain-containing protein [Lactifluus volemus]|nr:Ima1 N-terminal domain-containing protein [Lactifluus volemus]
MGTILRRQTPIVCFFCQTTISPPPHQPLSFLCPHCSCWNRYDSNMVILSDDPAMHDESLNRKSFARRASPRKDRLLTTFGNAPFCTTCQSNQRLVVSLLSSYLPPSDDDPDYAPRLAGFTAYKDSIYARYPPVCDTCAPLVEEEIRKKDVMARSNALGSWLNESKKKDTRRQVCLSNMDRHKLNRELRWWTARGVLWATTLLGSISVDVAGVLGRLALPPERSFLIPSLPIFVLSSILWTAWLPTYASFRRAELQGRKVRVRGRERYTSLQAAAWLMRMFTAILISVSWYRPSMDYLSLHSSPASISSLIFFGFALCFEVFTSVYSFLTLRLHRAPAVRLIDTTTSRAGTPATGTASRPSSPPPPAPHTSASTTSPPTFSHTARFDYLSLSSTAPRTRHAAAAAAVPPPSGRPVFGHPSLRPASFLPPPPTLQSTGPVPLLPSSQSRDAEMHSREDDEDDAMDWSPTASPVRPTGLLGAGINPGQTRMDNATTGLESLLERTNIDSSEPGSVSAWTTRRVRSATDRRAHGRGDGSTRYRSSH